MKTIFLCATRSFLSTIPNTSFVSWYCYTALKMTIFLWISNSCCFFKNRFFLRKKKLRGVFKKIVSFYFWSGFFVLMPFWSKYNYIWISKFSVLKITAVKMNIWWLICMRLLNTYCGIWTAKRSVLTIFTITHQNNHGNNTRSISDYFKNKIKYILNM